MPSPEEAQPYRLPALFEGGVVINETGAAAIAAVAAAAASITSDATVATASNTTSAAAAAPVSAAAAVHHAVGKCDSNAQAPTVVFVSKLMSVPAVDVRQRIASTDSAASATPAGGLQRITGALWTAPKRVQFNPSDNQNDNIDDADDEDEDNSTGSGATGAGAGMGSGSGGDNSGLPGLQGKEMLLAFARVFSGVLRASDFGDDLTPADAFEKNLACKNGGVKSTKDAQPLFLLGPKHQPLNACLSSSSNAAAPAAAAAAAADAEHPSTTARNCPRVTVAQSSTASNDDDVISHVIALTPCAGRVLAGHDDVTLPPPHPMVTSSTSTSSEAEGVLEEASAAAAAGGGKGDACSEPKTPNQRSPIALYLMMGDALEPVAEVIAKQLSRVLRSIQFIFGLSSFTKSHEIDLPRSFFLTLFKSAAGTGGQLVCHCGLRQVSRGEMCHAHWWGQLGAFCASVQSPCCAGACAHMHTSKMRTMITRANFDDDDDD